MNRADAETMAEGLRGTVSRLLADQDERRREIVEAQARVLVLESRLNAAEATNVELNERIQTAEAQRAESERRLVALSRDMVTARGRVEEAERVSVGVRVELDAEREIVRSLRVRTTSDQTKISTLQSDYDSLASNLKDLSSLISGGHGRPEQQTTPAASVMRIVSSTARPDVVVPVTAPTPLARHVEPAAEILEDDIFPGLEEELDSQIAAATARFGGAVDPLQAETEARAKAVRRSFATIGAESSAA